MGEQQFVYSWYRDMAKAYGNEVIDKDGNSYTWESALIRACYGTGEMAEVISVSGVITGKMLRMALRWEHGDWPGWVQR